MPDTPVTTKCSPAPWAVPKDARRSEQSQRLWEMTAADRVAAMYRGDLSLFQCLQWAARRPQEVPLINGEFAFIAIRMPEVAECVDARMRREPSCRIER